jgi:hypothetical protein
MDVVLQNIYFNVSHPASFSSMERLYKAARTIRPAITRDYVRKWLSEQDAYTFHRHARQKFKRSRLISPGLFMQADIDLADVSNLSKSNDGVHFLLLAIDSLSRKLYVQPLQSKKASDIIAGLEKLWGDDPVPRAIRSDSGKEFTNHLVQQYFKTNDVHHFTTFNSPKAHMVERAIKSFRMRLHRLITYRQSERFIDVLQEIVTAYNRAVHSSIGIAPNDVTQKNERAVWWTLYWPRKPIKKMKAYLFKVGDMVRISYARHAFTRAHDLQFTGEVFKIISRTRRDFLPVYKLEDLAGDCISGTFYTEELTASPHGDEWKIEKIIRSRKRKGEAPEVLVKWIHFPVKFNT